METYNERLFRARADYDPRYVEIRAKLLIRRLLCKIKFCSRLGQLNLSMLSVRGTDYLNNKWTLSIPHNTYVIDPISLFYIGVNNKSTDEAFMCRAGLRVRESVVRGFRGSECMANTQIGVLFWNIGRNIRYTVANDILKPRRFNPSLEKYITDEWTRLCALK